MLHAQSRRPLRPLFTKRVKPNHPVQNSQERLNMPSGMTINSKGELVPRNGGAPRKTATAGAGGPGFLDGFKFEPTHALLLLCVAFYLYDIPGVIICLVSLAVLTSLNSKSQQRDWGGPKKRSVNDLTSTRRDEEQERQRQEMQNTMLTAAVATALYAGRRRRR